MDIAIEKVRLEEKSILGNLLKMYCYEWSQYNGLDVDDQGIYEYEHHLSNYWIKEKYYPFFVRVDGVLAGFVLIDTDFDIHFNYDYAMSEFFIMYKYRRAGIGRYVARNIFDMFHGNWELKRHPQNGVAVKFWDSVIDEYTGGNYEIINACKNVVYQDGTCADILSFAN